ncbi:TIGR02206 family membrane protein [Nocardioides daejeonensis]|uniref:YwaF family protein n=1 Tax=Nocardioides daejeonensis TaxID=1046556 RepID=UPI000D74F5B1|nr:TIGR02206 family membrane protein [Nocardioides daejeonensis]
MLSAERTDFTTFGPVHLAMLVVFGVGCVALVAVGRRQRARGNGDWSRGLALAIPLFTVPMQVLQFLPGEWDLDTSLPLQICDVAWVVAAYALWTHRGWAVTANWLWGLTLTLQGMLTPDLGSGWGEPRFWMFWGMHWLIVWSAVYLVWGLGLAPTWRSFRTTVLLTSTWAVAVMVINGWLGTNYGYLNGKPRGASALDLLGPWPGYVLAEVAIVIAVWALLTWCWTRRDYRHRVLPSFPSDQGGIRGEQSSGVVGGRAGSGSGAQRRTGGKQRRR